jgi:hypothetical protein
MMSVYGLQKFKDDLFNPERFVLNDKLPNDKRPTLVLDLDETLIHCETEACRMPNPDRLFTVTFNDRDYHIRVQTYTILSSDRIMKQTSGDDGILGGDGQVV